MSHLAKNRLTDGREVWVHANGVVAAPVRSENSHEDEKEHQERQAAEPFAAHRGLDAGLLRRPTRGTHDFDLVDEGTVLVSLEVKGLTWPSLAMSALHNSGGAQFSLGDFEEEIYKDLSKANKQLNEATGAERVILIAWSYEDDPSSPWGAWLRENVSRMAEELGISHDVWITTPRAYTFDLLRASAKTEH